MVRAGLTETGESEHKPEGDEAATWRPGGEWARPRKNSARRGLRETQEVAEGSEACVATEEAGDLAGQGLGGHYKGCG